MLRTVVGDCTCWPAFLPNRKNLRVCDFIEHAKCVAPLLGTELSSIKNSEALSNRQIVIVCLSFLLSPSEFKNFGNYLDQLANLLLVIDAALVIFACHSGVKTEKKVPDIKVIVIKTFIRTAVTFK